MMVNRMVNGVFELLEPLLHTIKQTVFILVNGILGIEKFSSEVGGLGSGLETAVAASLRGSFVAKARERFRAGEG